MTTHKHRIYLIRHGETEWTLSGQHTGTTDLSLTENGKNQALLIKERLKNHPFAAVFCSPLARARETCELAGLGKKAQIEPHLTEWNYGEYEGLTTAEIHKTNPQWNIFKNGGPHGESPEAVEVRVKQMIALFQTVSGDVAVVSHGHFLRALATIWIGLPIEKGTLFALAPASLSILGFEREQHVIRLWNETTHATH